MKELIDIQANLKAHKGQKNTFGNYMYRSCEDILEAVKPLLLKNNCFLTIKDEIVMLGDRFYIKATATIQNKNGFKVETTALARESESKKGMDDSQVTGSTSSYARKYALNGLFAIDDTKDADTRDNSGPDKDFAKKLSEMKIKESDVIEYLQKSKGMKIDKIEKRLKENMLNNWDSFKSDYEKFVQGA